jgi:hypothetical protein
MRKKIQNNIFDFKIYEALEAKITSEPSKLSDLAIKMNALSERIRNITQPHFKEVFLLN